MSDNATLVERLNEWAGALATSEVNRRWLREAATRIDQLETALKPFADYAENNVSRITVNDYSRAVSVLSTSSEEKKP